MIENQAVKTIGSLALKELPEEVGKAYTKKEGFKLVVIQGTKNNPQKVAQVIDLTKVTSTQKKQLKDKIGEIFEEKLMGARLTTWQNWIDVIIPLWSIAGGVSLLNIAINGDIKTFMDEVAWEAMEALGWITEALLPNGSTTSLITDGSVVTGSPTSIAPTDFVHQQTATSSEIGTIGSGGTKKIATFSLPHEMDILDSLFIFDIKSINEHADFKNSENNSNTENVVKVPMITSSVNQQNLYFGLIGGSPTYISENVPTVNEFENEYFEAWRNGVLMATSGISTINNHHLGTWTGTSTSSNTLIPFHSAKRVIYQPMVSFGNGVFGAILNIITYKGDVTTLYHKYTITEGVHNGKMFGDVTFSFPFVHEVITNVLEVTMTVASGWNVVNYTPYVPTNADVSTIQVDELAIKSPVNIPVIDTTTGAVLTPTTVPDTGEIIYLDPLGQTVPETNISLDPNADIALQPNGEPLLDPYPESVPETPVETPPDSSGIDWSWWNWLKELLNEIWKLIKDIASWLNPFAETFFLWVALVPSENYWTDYWNDLAEGFNSKIPFFHQIYDFFGEIKDVSIGAKKPEFWVHIPDKYGGGSFNILDLTWYDQYRDYILMFMRFIMWFFFLKGMLRRLPRMVGD